MYAVHLSSPPAAASACAPRAGLHSPLGAWHPSLSVGPLPPSSSLSAGCSSFGFVAAASSLSGGGVPFPNGGGSVQQEGMDGAEDSSDDDSSDDNRDDEEEYIPAAAAADVHTSSSKKPSASFVAPLPTKKKNKKKKTSKKGATGGAMSDPQRKNRLATADSQTVLDLLPSAIRPPVECDLRSCTLGELRGMAVDPATAPLGSFLSLVGVLHQALNAHATTSMGGAGQLYQQRITVDGHSFTVRREATARASFQKRKSHGVIKRGKLQPTVLRAQEPAPLLLSAAGGAVLLSVSANLSKHLRTGAFPAQMRAQRGNEARPLAQVPYGVGQGEGSEICTLTLVYASSASSAQDISFARSVNFCAHGRITAGPYDVLPSDSPLSCGCRIPAAEQSSSVSFNVREWLSLVVDGRIVDDEGEAEEEADVYQLRVFQEGAKAQGHNVDTIEEAPAQAEPVSTRSSTLVIGAKQKKRSASVSVDVPTFPSSAASSPASPVSTEAASSSSSFSTPPCSKRARLSPLSSPSASSSSAFPSSPMEAEQEEKTVGQYAAAAAAALSSPPLSPSTSVYELSLEAAEHALFQPDDGLPASPVLRQPSSSIVLHPIDLSAMHDDACAYSSPIPSVDATAGPSSVRGSLLRSSLPSSFPHALSFDLSVRGLMESSCANGPQNAGTQEANEIHDTNKHDSGRLPSSLSSPLAPQPPQQQQQPSRPAASFRPSDDDGACMLGPLRPVMYHWNETALSQFPVVVAHGLMHPNAFFQ